MSTPGHDLFCDVNLRAHGVDAYYGACDLKSVKQPRNSRYLILFAAKLFLTYEQRVFRDVRIQQIIPFRPLFLRSRTAQLFAVYGYLFFIKHVKYPLALFQNRLLQKLRLQHCEQSFESVARRTFVRVGEESEITCLMTGKQSHVRILLSFRQVSQEGDCKQIAQLIGALVYLSRVFYPVKYLYKHVSHAYKIIRLASPVKFLRLNYP